MKKNAFDPVRVRIWALTGLMGLCLVAFAGVMYYTQILHGEENRAKSLASNAASETVEASRGIITDRNGKVLVSNRLTYTLIFSAKEFDTDQELNAAILRLTDLCTENGTAWNDTLPVSRTAPYSYTDPADGEGFALFFPFCWIDIFYDNQTYIGNQLHHPIYLFLWAFSSAIGFYYYSKKIWEKYNVNYNKKNHTLICLGMILSCSIPYNDITLLKDLHVWLSILFVAWFILEWFLYIPVHLNKNSILFFINIGLSFVFTFMFGHITGFCEIYFSFTTNILLHHWMFQD